MPVRAPRFSIILAAGKGTRMRSANLHKVCFPIEGKPAIHWALEAYHACGIRQHVLVVGALAGQVVETVGSRFAHCVFVYQAEQHGTAHATRVGLEALEAAPDDADILLVAGDRIIEPVVLERFFDLFYSRKCDLAVLACPRRERSSQGRIVQTPEGEPLAIVEAADIRQRAVYRRIRDLLRSETTPEPARLLDLLRDGFAGGGPAPSDEKCATAFGDLWTRLTDPARPPTSAELAACVPEEKTCFRFLRPDGSPLTLTPEEVDAMPLANNSVYLAKASALRYALSRLARDNAQREEYLSEIVALLTGAARADRRFRVRLLRVDDPTQVMGFNDPAELLEVEANLKARRQQTAPELEPSEWFRPVKEWRAELAAARQNGRAGAPGLWRKMAALYSDDEAVIRDRLQALQAGLDHAAAELGPDAGVFIVRSPGRVNVMGRHVDHQGGNCNLMTIGYETLMIVHPRDDDTVRLHNLDAERFPAREFSVGELIADLPWDDWLSLVNSEKVGDMVRAHGGDWSQYVKAAVLRLQKKFKDLKLRGMDLFVSGNVPMGAGLSSSSSLVVATAEATITANRLNTYPAQLVDLCGEGEWFVGTRGGSADHAAVKLGQRGRVIKVGFFDFAVEESVPFPEEHVMVLCDSGITARKTANAKDQFNHRVACYRLGFRLIRRLFPQYRPLLQHLRDVNPRKLGVPLSWIYKILLHLPERSTREELRELLAGEDLEPFFASHAPPADGGYPIRGVVLFGLAECERARVYTELLKAGRVAEIGALMNVSHNGDRVATFDPDGRETPYAAPTSNGYLLGLIEDLTSEDPERVARAQLQWQPGRYACSLPAIDRMVDLALATEGVSGAQLAGAGLGGCLMVLAHRDAVDQLVAHLNRQEEHRPARILICRPIAGAGVFLKDEPGR